MGGKFDEEFDLYDENGSRPQKSMQDDCTEVKIIVGLQTLKNEQDKLPVLV